MRLIIVRHGETVENRVGICQGQTAGTLTARGLDEAKAVGRWLHGEQLTPTVCYSSDLGRAMRTASAIASSVGLSVVPDTRLRERYFGSFQGCRFPADADPFFFSEAERPEAIGDRLLQWLRDVRLRHASSDTILMVSHGFTIRILVAMLMGYPPTLWHEAPEITNASVTIAKECSACDWHTSEELRGGLSGAFELTLLNHTVEQL